MTTNQRIESQNIQTNLNPQNIESIQTTDSQDIESNVKTEIKVELKTDENIVNEIKKVEEINEELSEDELIELSVSNYRKKVFFIMSLITIILCFITTWFGCESTYCDSCEEFNDNNTLEMF